MQHRLDIISLIVSIILVEYLLFVVGLNWILLAIIGLAIILAGTITKAYIDIKSEQNIKNAASDPSNTNGKQD